MVWILLRHESRQWPETPLSSKRLPRGENKPWPKAPLPAFAFDSLYVISKSPEADGFREYVFLPRYWVNPFGLTLQRRDERQYAFFFFLNSFG